MTNTQRIAELNDQYRKSLGVPGVPLVFTGGISALPAAVFFDDFHHRVHFFR